MFFDSEHLAENKLIILYALNQFKIPLSKQQITQIILENLQISYFDLQFYIDSLYKDEFISKYQTEEKEVYTITSKGRDILNLFIERIPPYIMNILDLYIPENRDKILRETRVIANYKKNGDGDFQVSLKLFENEICIIDLKLNVATNQQAQFICNNWNSNAENIYSNIIDCLIKQDS